MTQSKPAAAPKVGFVSLGCPKALVDSEHILTRLRAEGYEISPSYEGSDLVVINTCGFIDAAVEESLDAIGEALAENGKVIVTGCLGAKDDVVMAAHPQVLAVTGPHATEQVMQEVHKHLPKPHDPFIDLLPPQGIKLTPNHYAYLKISEGCNHRCTFCIIPSLRGDLVSRPIGDVMREAENLVNAGVKRKEIAEAVGLTESQLYATLAELRASGQLPDRAFRCVREPGWDLRRPDQPRRRDLDHRPRPCGGSATPRVLGGNGQHLGSGQRVPTLRHASLTAR